LYERLTSFGQQVFGDQNFCRKIADDAVLAHLETGGNTGDERDTPSGQAGGINRRGRQEVR
jgi:hypothetical protein